MTFDEMKQAVGRRASDPQATRYSTAIEDYIMEAIGLLLLDENLIEEQIPELAKELTRTITLESGLGKIAIDEENFPNVFRVIKPFVDPVSSDLVALTKDTTEKLNFRKNNPVLQPDKNEAFWAKDGNYIRFYLDTDARSITFKFKVINNVELEDLENADELNYGNQFLYSAIDIASKKLRQQVGME